MVLSCGARVAEERNEWLAGSCTVWPNIHRKQWPDRIWFEVQVIEQVAQGFRSRCSLCTHRADYLPLLDVLFFLPAGDERAEHVGIGPFLPKSPKMRTVSCCLRHRRRLALEQCNCSQRQLLGAGPRATSLERLGAITGSLRARFQNQCIATLSSRPHGRSSRSLVLKYLKKHRQVHAAACPKPKVVMQSAKNRTPRMRIFAQIESVAPAAPCTFTGNQTARC